MAFSSTRTKLSAGGSLVFQMFLSLVPLACSSASNATSSPPDGEAASVDGSTLADGGALTDAAFEGSCEAALVCDDFETYKAGSPPPSPWTVSKTAGSVAVDTTRAYTGSQSVKITAPASTGYQSVMLEFTGHGLPLSNNVVYGRMMFWLDSSPQTEVHWTFIDGYGLVPGMTYHAVERYGGQVPLTADDGGFLGSQLMASYDTPDSYNDAGPPSDCYQHAQNDEVVPVGVWSCAEWEFDGPDNTMRFWLDGQALTDLTVDGTGQGCTSQPSTFVWTAPTFTEIEMGYENYQPDDARNMWVDDVAIGPDRIGCP